MKPTRSRLYPGLTLLGSSEAAFPKSPEQAQLETFPNPNASRDYWIRLDCPEFTSLCPVTGQPDFAQILIEYVPDTLCVETKSLKLYLSSYRNVHSFNEQVVNRILDDFVRVCQPRRMRIEGRFVPRGGLALTVVVEHPTLNPPAAAPAAAPAPATGPRK
jgi:7-cyano-7-deazaguanine reductase